MVSSRFSIRDEQTGRMVTLVRASPSEVCIWKGKRAYENCINLFGFAPTSQTRYGRKNSLPFFFLFEIIKDSSFFNMVYYNFCVSILRSLDFFLKVFDFKLNLFSKKKCHTFSRMTLHRASARKWPASSTTETTWRGSSFDPANQRVVPFVTTDQNVGEIWTKWSGKISVWFRLYETRKMLQIIQFFSAFYRKGISSFMILSNNL